MNTSFFISQSLKQVQGQGGFSLCRACFGIYSTKMWIEIDCHIRKSLYRVNLFRDKVQ